MDKVWTDMPQMDIRPLEERTSLVADDVPTTAFRELDSLRTESVTMLAEPTALDPDAVAEELKRRRRDRQ